MLLLRRSIGPQDGLEQDLKGDVSLRLMFVMSDGSCLEQRGQCVASRPSRRLVLVPQSVAATPQSIQDREWDARVETYNRFSPLQDTQLEGSRPEDVAMTECSDIESCESAATQSGLRLVWSESEAVPEVRNAATLIGVFATRVSAVPHENFFAWCTQEAALVCIEGPSCWGRSQPRKILPSVRVVDFSNISSERTSAFLQRRNDSKRWLCACFTTECGNPGTRKSMFTSFSIVCS